MTQETVFNTTPVTTLNQFMFFGEQPNAARYDVLVHPIFDKLTDKMQGFFWKPQSTIKWDDVDLCTYATTWMACGAGVARPEYAGVIMTA